MERPAGFVSSASRSSGRKTDRRAFFERAMLSGAAIPLVAGPHTDRGRSSVQTRTSRPFELGTVTYNLARKWSLEELIENCETANFRAVELRSTHRHGVEPEISEGQRRAIRRRFSETDVKLLCLGTACEYHSPDPQQVQHNLERTRQFLELAADVGASGIKVRPNGLPDGIAAEKTLQQIGSTLREAAAAAEQHGVEIWVEAHGPGTSDPPVMKKIMDYCGHRLVGITWNCNPGDVKNGSVRPYFELLQDHIRNVHIHELFSDYPYRELFGLLSAMGYKGYTLSEIVEAKGDPVRFMRYYRMAWEALTNTCP